jgi:hypothetical protein
MLRGKSALRSSGSGPSSIANERPPGKREAICRACRFILIAVAAAASLGARKAAKNPAAGQPQPSSQARQAPADAILCRVLEVKTAPKERVELAVFHQARKEDGERLGELLRSRDGAQGKFQTPDGRWHAATVLRLGTCFGRGVLVFPARGASLVRKEEFWLKIPIETGSLDSGRQ